MNEASGTKVAVDIPSGINAGNGCVLGIAFRADYTVTFQVEKIGLIFYPGKEYAGKVTVTDIGISLRTMEKNKNIAICVRTERGIYRNALFRTDRKIPNKGSIWKAACDRRK